MSAFHEEEALGRFYDWRLTRRLLRYAAPYRGRIVLALLLTLAVAPLEAVGPYLFKVAVDSAIVPVLQHKLAVPVGLSRLVWISLASAHRCC